MTDILTHAQIWAALDALGAKRHLTPSALARKAGLDPTTFNRSKRLTPDGRQRWPSTESIAKVLAATGASLDEFMELVSLGGGAPSARRTRPLIGFEQAEAGGFIDESGFAKGGDWDAIDVLAEADEQSYALEISGDSMTPVYRDGDIVIVSPSAPVRRGDRVVVKTAAGELMARELKRQTARTIELRSFNADIPDQVYAKDEVIWMARIVWASQ